MKYTIDLPEQLFYLESYVKDLWSLFKVKKKI